MNNLLFYALLATLALYFFYYLPSQKKTSSRPSPQPSTSQSTQTDFIKSPSRSNTSLPEPIQYYESGVNLPGIESVPIIGPSALTPGSFPFSNQDQQELESTLDFLIKEMRDLDKSLD